MFHKLVDLGFVDSDFGSSAVCLILLGLMVIWQNRLSSWAGCRDINFQVNPNQARELINHPVVYRVVQLYLTPEIEVFYMLFQRCRHTKNRQISQSEYRILQFPVLNPVRIPLYTERCKFV